MSAEKYIPKAALVVMVVALLALTGCEKSYLIAGNTASMVVTCMLFWSTLKLNRKR